MEPPRTYTATEYRCRYGWPRPTRWYVFSDDGEWYGWVDTLGQAIWLVRFLLEPA